MSLSLSTMASTSPECVPQAAPYPFDHPQGDLILRSSDKPPVDFRVFKLLLSLASPFFSVLLSLPQPQSPLLSPGRTTEDGLSVIEMSEDQKTLSILLGFCYPISTHPIPRFSSLAELQTVAEAALKFEMEGVLHHIRQELVTPRFIESQPIRVFAISYRHTWMHEAKLAARYTLRHPILSPSSYGAELEHISAGAYHRLQEYHQLCGEVASSRALIQETVALAADAEEDGWVWFACRRCPAASPLPSYSRTGTPSYLRSKQNTGARRWWSEWVRGIAHQLLTRPRGETVMHFDLTRKALAEAERCPLCKTKARDQLDTFSQILSVRVEKDIARVSKLILRKSLTGSFYVPLC